MVSSTYKTYAYQLLVGYTRITTHTDTRHMELVYTVLKVRTYCHPTKSYNTYRLSPKCLTSNILDLINNFWMATATDNDSTFPSHSVGQLTLLYLLTEQLIRVLEGVVWLRRGEGGGGWRYCTAERKELITQGWDRHT